MTTTTITIKIINIIGSRSKNSRAVVHRGSARAACQGAVMTMMIIMTTTTMMIIMIMTDNNHFGQSTGLPSNRRRGCQATAPPGPGSNPSALILSSVVNILIGNHDISNRPVQFRPHRPGRSGRGRHGRFKKSSLKSKYLMMMMITTTTTTTTIK